MSLQEFADRLNISKTAAFHIEKSEANDRITLARLRSAAAALDCDVQIVIVPRSSLSQVAEDQAMKQAQEVVRRASHTMALEGQASYTTSDEELVKETAQEILSEGKIRWD